MSTNFVAGLVSGLDTTALIDALVTSRTGPILLLQQRQAQKTSQLSAWKSFEAILVGLKVETDRLANPSLWDSPAITTSDDTVLTVTADASAALSSYDFFVSKLAQAHQIQSVDYASRSELVGNGALSITVGTKTTDLTVAAGSTLDDLADQINDAGLGASATIVRSDDGTQETYNLVLTSDETGAGSSISVASSLTGGTDPLLATTVRAAQNAEILLGGETGLSIQSTTNTFENVVDGVDVTAQALSETGTVVTVSVARDTAGVEDAVSTFVDSYNAMISFVNGQFAFDPDVGNRPPLLGDSNLTSISGDLRRLVTAPLANGAGSITSLFGAGIRSSSNGTLTFNSADFQDALSGDFDAIADLFRANASFDTGGIRWLSAPEKVSLAGRQMDVVVTSAATRAVVQGADFDIGSGVVIDASNDTFRITIDGILSEDLQVAQGTYTDGDSLAAAVQNAVENSDKLGALGVQVSFTDSGGGLGNLTLTSNRYGSDGSIRLTGVANSSFAADVGLSAQLDVEATGSDVVGTIDGVTAEGNGQTLVVPEDHETLGGLSFVVTMDSGSTPATIQTSFTEGLGRTASRELLSLTDAADGRVARVGNSIQRLIDAMGEDVLRKQDALERYRSRLQAKYVALESTLGQLQSQGQFISAQIAAGQGGGFGISNS